MFNEDDLDECQGEDTQVPPELLAELREEEADAFDALWAQMREPLTESQEDAIDKWFGQMRIKE